MRAVFSPLQLRRATHFNFFDARHKNQTRQA
jgi:hypothetical protein